MCMAKEVSRRTFKVPVAAGQYIDVQIAEPALRAEGLSLQTWTSSFILASLLHKLDIDLSQCNKVIPVLELGAGTGLVGLTAARVWGTSVILTDLAPIVPGLAGNIALNTGHGHPEAATAECGSLDWKRPQELQVSQGRSYSATRDKAQIILAADTVYSEEHPELLSAVILQWLAPGPDSRAILTYPLRVAYLDQIRELWETLERGGLEAVKDGTERESTDTWDDECLCEWSVWRWKAE